jgi:hypothetical protein
MNVAAIGGMHATAKPRPTLPNRRRTKPATGAAMHAISPAVQIATAESSPCIPSGPLPKKNPDTAISSNASAASASEARINKTSTRLSPSAADTRERPGSQSLGDGRGFFVWPATPTVPAEPPAR